MGSVEPYATGSGARRYRVRYRTPQRAQTSKRGFRTRRDAELYLAGVEVGKARGEWVDPSAGRVTVGEWETGWLAAQGHWKPSTRARAEGIVRTHVMPRWGRTALADVRHADVQAWVSGLGEKLSASSVRQVHRVLSLVLELAVRDGRLARNPATGVKLPRVVLSTRRGLTHDQVRRLADEAGPHRVMVLVLAYTGLRWGEAAALRVGSLDLLNRRLRVTEAVTEVNGLQVWGVPKSHAARTVPLPRFLVDELARHVAGRGREQLVFPSASGEALRVGSFRRSTFDRAASRVHLEGLTPHELRHTAASLAIAAGANVKVVQQMLGHSTATLTLDRYGHLFPDQFDDLADALDLAASRTSVANVWPDAKIVDLHPPPSGR